jgi:SAM-dependent methyltransferase
MPEPDSNEALREEFNRWAETGRGDEMEERHLPITLPVLDQMMIAPDDNVLDVGCGAGWLSRLLAERLPEGRVVGMDISDEMVRRARKNYVALDNTMFVIGGVDEIPWDANFFTRAISVESAYYWPDPARGLREIFRVLREGGSAWVLIKYYRENLDCHQWAEAFATPTQLLGAEEWAALFRDAGFADVAYRQIPDPTPAPESYSGRWFRDAAQVRAFRETGALLVHGVKLEIESAIK